MSRLLRLVERPGSCQNWEVTGQKSPSTCLVFPLWAESSPFAPSGTPLILAESLSPAATSHCLQALHKGRSLLGGMSETPCLSFHLFAFKPEVPLFTVLSSWRLAPLGLLFPPAVTTDPLMDCSLCLELSRPFQSLGRGLGE